MKTLVFIFLITCHFAHADSTEPPFPEIRITISDAQFKKLLGSRGSKLDLKDVAMLINGDTALVKEVHSRGNNSLNFERKSLAVTLSNSVSIRQDGKKIKLKHFDLLNLVMDHNLWHSRFAFLAMADLGFFPLYNSYCKLWINGNNQGIYLLVEKPANYAKDAGSPYTIRRGPDHKIDKEYVNTDSKEETKGYKNQYNDIYHISRVAKGEELYSNLASKIDMKNYCQWLAFNYFIMNGDYADEVFLFIHPETKLFTVIPWDYDDIMRPSPHEGWENKNAVAKNKLIFSAEEWLDVVIANDAFTYKEYLTELKKIIFSLNEAKLSGLGNKVREELRILAADKQAASSTRFLDKDPFDIDKAEENLTISLSLLFGRRIGTLTQLDANP